jgi:monofunctional biosynthetic peptidoglycan transglycosylase
MASPKKPSNRKKSSASAAGWFRPSWRSIRLWLLRAMAGLIALFAALILLFAFVPPPINFYQAAEYWRLGKIEKDWVGWDEIAPEMALSVVAAEDANFCLHWGFDMAAIRQAISEGGGRGASTLSQQLVKNTFLWHGRNWVRKAAEATLTPVVELVWTKRRILHVYLNVVEFDEGIFGVQAAAWHYFGVDAKDLTALQSARLAAVLPDPKGRDAANPSAFVRQRTRSIMAGAATIAVDGRADCFAAQD